MEDVDSLNKMDNGVLVHVTVVFYADHMVDCLSNVEAFGISVVAIHDRVAPAIDDIGVEEWIGWSTVLGYNLDTHSVIGLLGNV